MRFFEERVVAFFSDVELSEDECFDKAKKEAEEYVIDMELVKWLGLINLYYCDPPPLLLESQKDISWEVFSLMYEFDRNEVDFLKQFENKTNARDTKPWTKARATTKDTPKLGRVGPEGA